MKRVFKWGAIGVGSLLILALAAFSFLSGGPENVYGLLRYGITQLREGDLKVGDRAPDFLALALDGQERHPLRARTGSKPLVLIFGSYT